MRFRVFLGLLLLAGSATADVTATVTWTPPSQTADGSPLTGDRALTAYELSIDGDSQRLPASRTRHEISVANGRTIQVSVRACNAYGCSGAGANMRFTAPGGAGANPAPPPEPTKPVAPAPAGRQALWRGMAVGSDVVDYGHLLDGYDGEASEVVIRLSGATGGRLFMSYPIRLRLVNRRIRAEWHHPEYQRTNIMMVNPVIVRAGETREIRFYCDTETDVWMLDVSGTRVAAENATRCIGNAWGSLRVGGAGGEAKIEVHDVP